MLLSVQTLGLRYNSTRSLITGDSVSAVSLSFSTPIKENLQPLSEKEVKKFFTEWPHIGDEVSFLKRLLANDVQARPLLLKLAREEQFRDLSLKYLVRLDESTALRSIFASGPGQSGLGRCCVDLISGIFVHNCSSQVSELFRNSLGREHAPITYGHAGAEWMILYLSPCPKAISFLEELAKSNNLSTRRVYSRLLAAKRWKKPSIILNKKVSDIETIQRGIENRLAFEYPAISSLPPAKIVVERIIFNKGRTKALAIIYWRNGSTYHMAVHRIHGEWTIVGLWQVAVQ